MASRIDRAKSAGRRYAADHIQGTHFLDWVYDQLDEGEKLEARGQVAAGLETENLVHLKNAKELARRMLQDVRWGTSRDIDRHAILAGLTGAKLYDPSRAEERAFMEGVRAGYDSTQSRVWLADVIKGWAEREMEARKELLARCARSSRRGSRRSRR
jgi:hypothetical protein